MTAVLFNSCLVFLLLISRVTNNTITNRSQKFKTQQCKKLAPNEHLSVPCLLQLGRNLISMNLLVLFHHSCFILGSKCPAKAPEQTSFSSSTCLLIPKDSLNPVYQLLCSPASLLRRLWADSSPGVCPACQLQPVLLSNFSTLWQLRPSPFLGWNQEKSWKLKGAFWAAEQRRTEPSLSRRFQWVFLRHQTYGECFPHCLLFSFSLPFESDWYFLFLPGWKKLQLNVHFLFNL